MATRLHPSLTNDARFLCFVFGILIGGLFNGLGGIPVLVVLHYGVGDHANHQNSQHDVQFILHAQEGAVGEGDDETKRLPHAVVGKGGLLVPREEDAIKSCNRAGDRSIRR